MKTKDDKCHLILSFSEKDTAVQIGESTTRCTKVKRLLGIHTEYKFKFDARVGIICKKACRRLNG